MAPSSIASSASGGCPSDTESFQTPPDSQAEFSPSASPVSFSIAALSTSRVSSDGIGIGSQQPLLSAVIFDYFSPGSVATRQESSRPSIRTIAPTPSHLAVRTVQVLGSEERETVLKSFAPAMISIARSREMDHSRGTPSSEDVDGCGVMDGGRRIGKHAHTTYRVRALVGPFECTSSHRFSEFLELHSQLQRSCGKDKTRKQHLALATPSGKKLRESTMKRIFIPNHERLVEARRLLIARYCDELCAASSLAHSEIVTGFFWPCDGAGSVVAPDGSIANLMGDAAYGGISYREATEQEADPTM